MNLDKREKFLIHVQDIANRFSNDKLNLEMLRSPFVSSIIKETIRTIMDEMDNEKIEAQKPFLLISYTNDDPVDIF